MYSFSAYTVSVGAYSASASGENAEIFINNGSPDFFDARDQTPTGPDLGGFQPARFIFANFGAPISSDSLVLPTVFNPQGYWSLTFDPSTFQRDVDGTITSARVLPEPFLVLLLLTSAGGVAVVRRRG